MVGVDLERLLGRHEVVPARVVERLPPRPPGAAEGALERRPGPMPKGGGARRARGPLREAPVTAAPGHGPSGKPARGGTWAFMSRSMLAV